MKPSRRRCKFGAAGSFGPPGIKARPCLWHGATEAGNNEKLRNLPSTIRTCLDVRHLLRWQMERRQVHVRFAHERGNQMTDAGARDSDLLKCNGCSQPFVKDEVGDTSMVELHDEGCAAILGSTQTNRSWIYTCTTRVRHLCVHLLPL